MGILFNGRVDPFPKSLIFSQKNITPPVTPVILLLQSLLFSPQIYKGGNIFDI